MGRFLSVQVVLKIAGDQYECLGEEVEIDFWAWVAANSDAG
jgi:hypothetical protein